MVDWTKFDKVRRISRDSALDTSDLFVESIGGIFYVTKNRFGKSGILLSDEQLLELIEDMKEFSVQYDGSVVSFCRN